MNPIRVFARLAARVPPCDLQPGSTGEPPIDAAHAAALCAGMNRRFLNAALAQYAQDETVRGWLGIELWQVSMSVAQRDNWKTAGRTVSRHARWDRCYPIWDAIGGAERESFERIMVETEGAGYTRCISAIVMAEIYDGRHWRQPDSWKKKAAILGVGKAAYFSTWNTRIAAVGMALDSWSAGALDYVRARQRRSEAA